MGLLIPAAKTDLVLFGSLGWTRTSNPSVNSRMLCRLSYQGVSVAFSAGLTIAGAPAGVKGLHDN